MAAQNWFSEYFHEIISGLFLLFMVWHLRTPFLLSDLNHAINRLNDWLKREVARLDNMEKRLNDNEKTQHTHDKRLTMLEWNRLESSKDKTNENK